MVVLAFDDYSLVPKAKAITQAARRARLVPLEFDEGDPLPEFPPDPWTAAMINRTFKARVIQLVVEALPTILRAPGAGSALIVDWKGGTCSKWEWMEDGTIQCSEMPREPAGEADIKFSRWATRLGVSMGAEATDGDFVPIALMSSVGHLFVLRNEVNGEKPQDNCGGGSIGGRQHEWVDIDLLRKGLIDCMAIKSQSIEPLIVLIAMTGTDFSRGLPWVGPKRLIKVLGIFSIARRSLTEDHQIDPLTCLDQLVSPVYHSLYRNHVSKGSFADVMGALTTTPSLSKRVKDKFPLQSQVLTTLRNANFILQYWAANDPMAPDSLAPGLYGFRMGADSNRVEWDD